VSPGETRKGGSAGKVGRYQRKPQEKQEKISGTSGKPKIIPLGGECHEAVPAKFYERYEVAG